MAVRVVAVRVVHMRVVPMWSVAVTTISIAGCARFYVAGKRTLAQVGIKIVAISVHRR